MAETKQAKRMVQRDTMQDTVGSRLLQAFFKKKTLLKYSCFAMLYWFLLDCKRESVICISSLLWVSFPFRSPQITEQCSLGCTVASH